MSEQRGKLALALAKAQGQMKGAIKDAANPYFKSTYADLASVWNACREALSQNELAVAQLCDIGADGRIMLNTILMHSSGENLTGSMPVMIGEKATAQQLGSAITYARRYALSAMVGIAPEDDDGNAASETPVKSPMKQWAETDPSLAVIKDGITEFVRLIEAQETVTGLEDVITENKPLLKRLERLPQEWIDRTNSKIAQCREAFEMSHH